MDSLLGHFQTWASIWNPYNLGSRRSVVLKVGDVSVPPESLYGGVLPHQLAWTWGPLGLLGLTKLLHVGRLEVEVQLPLILPLGDDDIPTRE